MTEKIASPSPSRTYIAQCNKSDIAKSAREHTMTDRTRQATTRLHEMIDNGELDCDLVITACLKFMSEADVAEMCHANEFFTCQECGSSVDANAEICEECSEDPTERE